MDNDHYFTELKRGTIIIAVLSQLKKSMYGYELVRLLNDAGYNIEQSTLYPLLRRLEKQNILQSTTKVYDSRERKYYSLTPNGEKLYAELVKVWSDSNLTLKNLIEQGEEYE